MINIILISCLLTSTLILLLYYSVVFSRLNRKQVESEGKTIGVSVVICARNEAENLKNNLPLILEQNHPDFEVIVVDDASWDDSNVVLSEFKKTYPKLQIVSINEEQKRTPGKKMALTLGFKRASKDVFLLTDADCRPKSKEWIKSMTNGPHGGIRLGYGAYKKDKGVVNLLVRFETFSIAIQYLAAALAGLAYMGVGRNLSYSRSLYHESGGFKAHYHLMSGDDDLFVNHNATAKNISISISEQSHTSSESPESFTKWISQKRRHMSVSSAYSMKSKIFLAIYHISQLVFYTSIAGAIVTGVDWKIVLGTYSLKTIIHLLISKSTAQHLKENGLVVLLPILEPVLLLVNVIVGAINQVRRPKAWK